MGIYDEDGPIFTDLEWSGETGRYIPRTGDARNVNAVVYRYPPQAAAVGGGRVLEFRVEIEVANNSTDGISRTELKLGVDKFEICPTHPGGTVQQFILHMPEDGKPWIDAGMMRLALK